MSLSVYGGSFGNTIFFISSAWFLLDKSKTAVKKLIYMISDVWLISMGFLIVTLVQRRGDMSIKLLIKSFFPTIFENNWYISCYIVFCLIVPFLNYIIKNMSRRSLFRTGLTMFIICICINFFSNGAALKSTVSSLSIWVALYFLIAYMKYYLPKLSSDLTVNIVLLCVGIFGNILMVAAINLLGLRISFLSNQLSYGAKNNNPFIIIAVIALFNIARCVQFKNKFINSFSKLSLLIYIIHENILFRSYYRPLLWKYVYENFGYEHILAWDIVISVSVLICAAVISWAYSKTLQKAVKKVCDKVYPMIESLYGKFENILLRLN